MVRTILEIFLFLFLVSCSGAAVRQDSATDLYRKEESGAPPRPAADSSPTFHSEDPAARTDLRVQDPAGAGIASTKAASEAVASRDDPNRLVPGFGIRISFPEDRDVNGVFRIEFDGMLSLPYGIRVRAEGLTLDELRKKLTEIYRPFYKGQEIGRAHV